MSDISKLSPRPFLSPGRPFANRQRELELIRSKLNRRQGDKMSLVVTCFWAAAGTGKSWLLQDLEQLYQDGGPRNPGTRPTIAARLDLSPGLMRAWGRDNRLDVSQLIQELWKQLARQTGSVVPELVHATPEKWAAAFVQEVTAWLATWTPLVILDTMETLVREDEAAFFWLEEHLVEPLAMTDQVLFIFASRGEMRRWRRFQVRRRVDMRSLGVFEPDHVAEQLKTNQSASEALYRHAFGHPLATEYLGTVLEERGLDLTETTATEVEAALDPATLRTVLGQVSTFILRDVPADLAGLAQKSSVLRRVDVDPLRYLENWLRVSDAGQDAFYLDQIGQFQTCHLVYWNIDSASYEFPPAVRGLLAHSLQLNDSESFCQAHMAAYEYYRRQLKNYPRYLARYVPEVAYHGARLSQCSSLPVKLVSLGTWWERELMAKPEPADPDPWSELERAWQQDQELKYLFSKEQYRHLTSDISERAAVKIAKGSGAPQYA